MLRERDSYPVGGRAKADALVHSPRQRMACLIPATDLVARAGVPPLEASEDQFG